MTDTAVRVDRHLAPEDLGAALRADAHRGLTATPKDLPPKWFYDDRGSDLFDQITRLPEYYPTRTERSILDARAGEIATRSGADTLVELGSGTSEKTRLLLDAFAASGRLDTFVPFDVSEATLRDAAAAVAREYPGVGVHAVVGDFERHLEHIPSGGNRLVAFLGGTIGNFAPAPRAAFLASLARTLAPGETLLLGTDLVKDTDRLVRRLRRRRGSHGRLQQERAPRPQPRARGHLRSRRLRPRRALERRRRVDRDAAARPPGPAR